MDLPRTPSGGTTEYAISSTPKGKTMLIEPAFHFENRKSWINMAVVSLCIFSCIYDPNVVLVSSSFGTTPWKSAMQIDGLSNFKVE